MAQNTYRFQATIYRIWIMRHVDVPNDVAHALQKQLAAQRQGSNGKGPDAKYIPVVARVSGKHVRTTLVPAGGGRLRMQINTALRKAADAGDLVGVELCLDLESRELSLPTDFAAGLKRHPKAWKAFEALAPGHRRELIAWFDSAKSPATRSRRLDRTVDMLLERALLGPKRTASRDGGRRASHPARTAK